MNGQQDTPAAAGYLSVAELAVALRLSTGAEPPDPLGKELRRLRKVACELIGSLPLLSSCPQAVKDDAAVAICGFRYDGPAGERPTSETTLRRSGALGILRPWIKRGGARIA